MEESRKQVGPPLYHVKGGELPSNDGRVEALAVLLDGGQPNVCVEYVREVFGTLFVKELCFGLPVYPTVIEGPVAIPDDFFCFEASPNKISPCLSGVEPCRICHGGWHDGSNVSVVEVRIKILLHAVDQPLPIDVHHDFITARLHSRRRGR